MTSISSPDRLPRRKALLHFETTSELFAAALRQLAITAIKIINENRDRASNIVNKLTVSFNQWTKRIARQFEI